MLRVWTFIFLFLSGNLLAQADGTRLRILAKVGNRSISDRELRLEAYIENPSLYQKSKKLSLSKNEEQSFLQQLIMELMIEEENRIVGSDRVGAQELLNEFNRLKGRFSNRWSVFLKDNEISEQDVKDRLERRLLVNRMINSRLKDVDLLKDEKKSKSQVLEDWIAQLRARYRVQMFQYE